MLRIVLQKCFQTQWSAFHPFLDKDLGNSFDDLQNLTLNTKMARMLIYQSIKTFL